PRGVGQRPGNRGSGHVPGLRSVLHDQEARARNGPRPRDLCATRRGHGRRHRGEECPGRGRALYHTPAGGGSRSAKRTHGEGMKILIIDDDAGLRKSLSLILGDAGYAVVLAEDGESGLQTALEHAPDLILCDVRMPRLGGIEFLDAYQEAGGAALVLVMTAYGGLELAMKAMKKGAYDYLPKPFGADEVLLTVRKAEERERLRREVGRLRDQVRADARFSEIVVGAPAMERALEIVRKVARHDSPVLITGAS